MTIKQILLAIEETGYLPKIGVITRQRLVLSGLVDIRSKKRAYLTSKGVAFLLAR